MKWTYFTEILPGNFHAAVANINAFHPEWDVITMKLAGDYTIIVYRRPFPFAKGRGDV